MPEIDEKVSAAIERAEAAEEEAEKGGGKAEKGKGAKESSKLNSIVATLVAVGATFLALCNVKGGNVVQAMSKTQVEIVDGWAFFQAKSTKQALAEASIDQLTIMRTTSNRSPEQLASLDKQLDGYRSKVARYEREKDELKVKVDGLQKEYDRLNVKDDQFDISEALVSVAIALYGITALTQKRLMLIVASAFAGFGVIVGLAGFFGWNIRPEWLAKILGA